MKPNDYLKDFKFKIATDKFIEEQDLRGQKVLVYFYPKDDTPGCTVEANDFSKFKKKFLNLNTQIFGISKDNIEKHEKFKKKHNLKIELVSDENGEICQLFKVWVEKSMYGKKYMGIERSTFLFDENLKLIKIWRNVKVKGHVEEVLNYVQSIC